MSANGDVLYMNVSGAVLPSDDRGFDFMFQDPFTFDGGVVQSTNRTGHAWSGTMELVPGV